MNISKLFYYKFHFLLFGLLILVFLNSLNKALSHDELEAIHSSWKILNGEKIYVDFFQHHHPLFYFALAPILALIGENIYSIITIRIIMFFIFILILITVYFLTRRIFNKETSYISLLLLPTMLIFTNRAIEIRPDVLQTLFALLSLFFLFTYFEIKILKYLILSSFCLAISFLFLQKTIFLIFLIGILLIKKAFQKRISYKAFIGYILIFFITLLPFFLYYLFTKTLSNYIGLNWTLNIQSSARFLPFAFWGESYRENSLIWIFYCLGLLFFLKKQKQKQLGFISIGLLGSLFLYPNPYRQYFMIPICLVVIISAYAIYLIFKGKIIILSALLIIILAFPSFLLIKSANQGNNKKFEKINYVLSLTGKEDFVYDGDIRFNLFRKDVDFFWYSIKPNSGLTKYNLFTNYDYNIYESIEKYKPKVISSYLIENMSDKRISDNYQQSEKYKDLFIRKTSDAF